MEQFQREREIQIPKFYSYTSKNICLQQPTRAHNRCSVYFRIPGLWMFAQLHRMYISSYYLQFSILACFLGGYKVCSEILGVHITFISTINTLDHHFWISACGRFASIFSDIRRFNLTSFTMVATQCGATVSRWSPTGLFLAGWSWSRCWPPALSSSPSIPSSSQSQLSSDFPSRSFSG